MKRPVAPSHGSKESSGWTANSDLFMAIAIVFLMMFIFALLSSGASQIALQKDKIEAQKHLLGKLPESDKLNTQKQMEMAAKDIKDISQKREMLKESLTQLAQMAETLDSREQSLKNFYESQNKNIAKIEQSRETIEKQAEELTVQKKSLQLTQAQLNKIEKEAAENQEKLLATKTELDSLKKQRSGLQVEQSSLSKESASLKSDMNRLTKEAEALAQQNKSLEHRVADLSSELKAQRSETATAQLKNKELLAAERSKGQELNATEKAQAKMQRELEGLRAENKDLKAQNGGLKQQLESAAGEAKQAGKSLKEAEGKAKGLVAANAELGEALKSGQSESKGLKSQLAALEKQHRVALADLDGSQKQNQQLDKKLAAALHDHKELSKEAEDLAQRLNQIDTNEKDLNDKFAKESKARVACETEKDKTKGQQQKIASDAKAQKEKLDAVGKTLADARKAVQEIDNERKRIAGTVAQNLKASGVEVDINPETGNITLRMDEAFYFKNASYQLRDEAKLKISQIVPIYAKSLLENPKIAQRIENILVTGYASPKFKKEYVDPSTVAGEAYDYNLELSVNRAREIVTYMFGQEIKDFPYKDKMRHLVSVSGTGMMNAILLDNESVCSKDPEAQSKFEECTCGPFDCKKSRRVELQFVLKNQKDTDRQLQKITDKLIEKETRHDAH